MLSLIILSVAFIYCFIFTPIIENINDNSIFSEITKIHRKCFLDCQSKDCKDIITKFYLWIDESDKTFSKIDKNILLKKWETYSNILKISFILTQ